MTEPRTPAALGYRWPAEWERHAATWLSWPHNLDTWPGHFAAVPGVFGTIVRALHEHELVRINVGSSELEDSARQLLSAAGVNVDRGVRFQRIATNDAWVRDHGGILVVREHAGQRERAVVDFEFDSWGKKYGPWDLDRAVPVQMARALGVPQFRAGVVLEGGSIDGNGEGTVLTTESCLLNPNRGPGRTREGMERVLADQLGTRHVLWLGEGIAGDDTDGHVDDLARFVDAGTVVTALEDDSADENFAPLKANLARLRAMRDPQGKPFAIATLPMPPPLFVDGQRCPASYANFYLANGVALVPTYGAPSDSRALAVLRELLPGREIVGIPCGDLVYGLGAIHCVTQQEPA
jgi:agmatine deiminase